MADEGKMVSVLTLLSVFFITSASGLNVTDPLPTPWSDQHVCGSSGDQNYFMCDPDKTINVYERQLMGEIIKKCQGESRLTNLNMTIFVTASLAFPANLSPHNNSNMDDSQERARREVERLQQMVVASYGFSTSQDPIVLLLATEQPFQVSVWVNPRTGITSNETKKAEEMAHDSFFTHHPFYTALQRSVDILCQEVGRKSTYKTDSIILTVTWIFLSLAFIFGLVAIAVWLIRAAKSRESQEDPNEEKDLDCHQHRQPSLPPTDLTTVSYRSTGHVLLGTTDITALTASTTSSTDNLLNT